jgi:hypothetical protein
VGLLSRYDVGCFGIFSSVDGGRWKCWLARGIFGDFKSTSSIGIVCLSVRMDILRTYSPPAKNDATIHNRRLPVVFYDDDDDDDVDGRWVAVNLGKINPRRA